jgi:hypothetical protein
MNGDRTKDWRWTFRRATRDRAIRVRFGSGTYSGVSSMIITVMLLEFVLKV